MAPTSRDDNGGPSRPVSGFGPLFNAISTSKNEVGAHPRPTSSSEPVFNGASPSSTWSEQSYFKEANIKDLHHQWNDSEPRQVTPRYDEFRRSFSKPRPITMMSEKIFSFRNEDNDAADVPRPSRPEMFRRHRGMYGAEPYDDKLSAEQGAESDDEFDDYPTGWRRAALLASALVPYCIASLDDNIITTLIPVLIDQFKRPEDIGWYTSAEYLPYAVLMPSLGKAYNLWKIKWLFLASLLIFMVGSITCSTANTSLQFIIGRAITGSGGAGILQGAMRINQIAFPRRQRMYVEAVGVAIMGVCIMAGPLVGGAIAGSLGWQWAFWINLPTSAFSFLGILFVSPHETPRSPLYHLTSAEKVLHLDPVGASLLIASICCLISVLQSFSASINMWLSQTDIVVSVMAGVLFVLFLFQEAFVRPDLALIPRSILQRQAVWSNCALLFFLFMGFTIYLFFLSIFLQVVKGDSPGESAIHLLPYVISASIGSSLTAVCAPRTRYYNPFFLVGGVLFVVGMVLTSKIDQNVEALYLSGLQVVTGLGVGILVLANVVPCHVDLPEKDHSLANGLAFFTSSLGSTITIPASSAMFNHHIIQGFQNLDIPLLLKLEITRDITSIRRITPPEYLDPVFGVVVGAINLTFIIGLTCSCLTAVMIFTIPWKPVVKKADKNKDSEASKECIVQVPSAVPGGSRRMARRFFIPYL